ncbi:Uncharacterised protein [Mycolicibacterium aurum]|uniref:GLTT repeat protein n=1 Tax=Mycolicibacterium aurum TaxID=1791 RepID=A0A3S4TEB6_MYCAU|nr:hypothetical protein [Mycolicibacterium aurum]VEG57271.1 Uncharacterised protein [Mycolicibacterium aurum]
MHRTRKLFATTMIAAAGAVSAAVAFSAAAVAQPAPAPAPAPAVPGLPFLQQLAANPAAATQLMQTFANVMGTAPAATATTTPATPVSGPGATASINLPQPINTMQGTVPGAPVTPALPGLVPVGNTTTVPPSEASAPATSPLDGLTESLGLPAGGLASLLPAGNPLAGLLPGGTTTPAPVAAPAPAPAAPTLFTPLAALP